MTVELARSRGLSVVDSGYDFVQLLCGQVIPIEPEYIWIMNAKDEKLGQYVMWRQDIPGNELADILAAGLVELEGEPDE